jgi:hypothetical protein
MRSRKLPKVNKNSETFLDFYDIFFRENYDFCLKRKKSFSSKSKGVSSADITHESLRRRRNISFTTNLFCCYIQGQGQSGEGRIASSSFLFCLSNCAKVEGDYLGQQRSRRSPTSSMI